MIKLILCTLFCTIPFSVYSDVNFNDRVAKYRHHHHPIYPIHPTFRPIYTIPTIYRPIYTIPPPPPTSIPVVYQSSKTLIIVILDESGSMAAKKTDVLGGFNSFINDQKQVKSDPARFYLVKFNTIVTVVHTGVQIESVPELNDNTYRPAGGTALYDAIAEGVRIAERDKRPEERVICVIMTDGEENSSHQTSKDQVKEIISGHEHRGDWTFLYIGENPDRWARETGMSHLHGIAYDHARPMNNYESANKAVNRFRMSGAKQGHNLFAKA